MNVTRRASRNPKSRASPIWASSAAQNGVVVTYAPGTVISRNVIGGHTGYGVSIGSNSLGFEVSANGIGDIGDDVTYANGTGIQAFSDGVIGQTTEHNGNTITANSGRGIVVASSAKVRISANSTYGLSRRSSVSVLNARPRSAMRRKPVFRSRSAVSRTWISLLRRTPASAAPVAAGPGGRRAPLSGPVACGRTVRR